MDCNRDEASRAKEIAEKKFSLNDIAGAKKLALKAQSLYPDIYGISQMIATFDVYISAEVKIKGEPDWYGILGVDPRADVDTMRKQFRKLALILHPDKNTSVGADGAFKLISEAWNILSDKEKRAIFDRKRNVSVKPSRKTSTSATGSSVTSDIHCFNSFCPSAKEQKNSPQTFHRATPFASGKSQQNTFWTRCNPCKMQYEYPKVYRNHMLLCPDCHKPFLAAETAPSHLNGLKSSTAWKFSRQHENLKPPAS